MKGVADPGLAQVAARVEQHVREAKRITTQAKVDGIQPPADPRRERQMVREMAQQMWRGTSPEDVDALRTRARERLRTRTCTLEDLVATSETATRLREEGIEPTRAMRVAGEALRRGYGAEEMLKLQYMMVYRHREGRGAKGLVDDFEHCLGAGMDAAHMYRYMMQNGWMGPGDVQGPGGSRPIDDPRPRHPGRRRGHGRSEGRSVGGIPESVPVAPMQGEPAEGSRGGDPGPCPASRTDRLGGKFNSRGGGSMKRSILVLSLMMLITLLAAGSAAAAGTPSGANHNYQWLTDSDGDGIPNCEDADYTPPLDGTGFQRGKVPTNTSSEFTFRYNWNWRLSVMFGGWLRTSAWSALRASAPAMARAPATVLPTGRATARARMARVTATATAAGPTA